MIKTQVEIRTRVQKRILHGTWKKSCLIGIRKVLESEDDCIR